MGQVTNISWRPARCAHVHTSKPTEDAAREIAQKLIKIFNPMNEEPIEITLLVIAALERLSIRYFIAGSLASAIYGGSDCIPPTE